MQRLELAATLYARRGVETREQAKRMVNASVRDVMERLASLWETMAERVLVSHVLDHISRDAEVAEDAAAASQSVANIQGQISEMALRE